MKSTINLKNSGIIVITGGGSGGHTTTAMTVIDELKRQFPGIEKKIVFVGGSLSMTGEDPNKQSLEEKLVKDKGIAFIKVRSGKLQRYPSLDTLKLLFGVFWGVIDSIKFFSKHKVSLVFSSGGYVTVSVCFVAWLKKVPVVIHEQTTRVGLSNRIVSIFARKVLVGFLVATKFFPKRTTIFVGNTIRKCFVDPTCIPEQFKEMISQFKSRSKRYPIIMITGGGQGSHLVNEVARDSLKPLLSRYQLIVITGDNAINNDYNRLAKTIKTLSGEMQSRIVITKYAGDEIGAFINMADVFVGRGGAMFTSEIGFTQTPGIIIPIPWVTHNEQYFNAQVLADLGLVRILEQGKLSPEILTQYIDKLVEDIKSGKLKINSRAISKLFPVDSSTRIVGELEKITKLC